MNRKENKSVKHLTVKIDIAAHAINCSEFQDKKQ